MKTEASQYSNELALLVSNMQNNNQLWLYKHTHVFSTVCNFIGIVFASISIIGNLASKDYISMSFAIAALIFCATNFMQQGIYYVIELPYVHTKKLFKIGDVYFVGANKREAELYAHIKKLDGAIECISPDCDSF